MLLQEEDFVKEETFWQKKSAIARLFELLLHCRESGEVHSVAISTDSEGFEVDNELLEDHQHGGEEVVAFEL